MRSGGSALSACDFEHHTDLLARAERDDDAIADLERHVLGQRVFEQLGERHRERHPRAKNVTVG